MNKASDMDAMSQNKFNKEIYKKKALVKAIRAYRHIGKFTVQEQGGYFLVNAKPLSKGLSAAAVLDEFANFVLAESIKK